MGESLFIEPMKRWFQRRFSSKGKTADIGEKEEELEQMASSLGVSHGGAEVTPPSGPLAAESKADAPTLSQPGPGAPTAKGALLGEAGPTEVTSPQAKRVNIEGLQTQPRAGAEAPAPQARRITPRAAEGDQAKEASTALGAGARSQTLPREAQAPASKVAGSEEASDALPLGLKGIFRSKVEVNPHVRALVERHGTVSARELADELRELAKSLGIP